MCLDYLLMQICKRCREGSHSTQANRKAMLKMFVEQLAESGYCVKTMKPSDLKGRHVNKLIKVWRIEGVSTGTIKNRMAVVRWWAEKVNNPRAVKSNKTYGIENRIYVTNSDKSNAIEDFDLSDIDENVAQSLRLQDAFGLRREEAMKFCPSYALDGQNIKTAHYIRLKSSWTKGGRPRTIPITTEDQRQQLISAYELASKNGGSMIPKEKSYAKHLSYFESITHSLGLGNTHSLRHGYAQRRYLALMGFECPAKGNYRSLTENERLRDIEIRLEISKELGHSRINVTSIYLGSWRKANDNCR